MASSLRVENVTKRFGGLLALDNVSLRALPGRVTSIIGQNGAGKTTLLDAIAQLPAADSGRVFAGEVELTRMAPYRVASHGVARAFQQLRIFTRLSVLDNVLLGFQGNRGEALWNLMVSPFTVRRQQLDHIDRARAILDQVDLLGLHDAEAGTLSYGLQKLLSLARVMATDADIVMLDEPTSGLSNDFIERILEIVRRMRDAGKTIVLVAHDMDIVFDVSDTIVVLDQGKVFAEGAPEEIRRNAAVRAIYFGSRAV
jgi:ABC-type branched-subunit amino acid transport system ATPase component